MPHDWVACGLHDMRRPGLAARRARGRRRGGARRPRGGRRGRGRGGAPAQAALRQAVGAIFGGGRHTHHAPLPGARGGRLPGARGRRARARGHSSRKRGRLPGAGSGACFLASWPAAGPLGWGLRHSRARVALVGAVLHRVACRAAQARLRAPAGGRVAGRARALPLRAALACAGGPRCSPRGSFLFGSALIGGLVGWERAQQHGARRVCSMSRQLRPLAGQLWLS